MNKKNWMSTLASHYDELREKYPEDRLLILFDVDGTILDMRSMVFYVLKAYDRVHETKYFQKLQPSDINVHENQVEDLLSDVQVPEDGVQA